MVTKVVTMEIREVAIVMEVAMEKKCLTRDAFNAIIVKSMDILLLIYCPIEL
jgi:hypothetical protein